MIRIGIIGGGRMAERHAQNLRVSSQARLEAVFDLEGDRAIAFTQQFGGRPFFQPEDDFFSQVDAVIITAPTEFHPAYMLSSALRGKHVFCEKPIAVDVEKADEMIACASSTGVVFMVGHVFRFQKELSEIKQKMETGLYGPLVHFHASRLSGLAGGSWKGWILKNLGALDIHIHDLDFIFWLFGPSCVIHSKGVRNREGDLIHVTSLMEFKGVYQASAEGSFMLPPGFPFIVDIRMVMKKATIHFRYTGETYGMKGQRSLFLYHQDGKVEPLPLSGSDPIALELEHFCDCIESGIQPGKGTPQDARHALVLALAAKESIESGRPIRVPG